MEKLRILLVEDNTRFIQQAKEMLTDHELVFAENFRDTKKILAEQRFDVVLTDLNFPLRSRGQNEEETVEHGEIKTKHAERQPRPFGSLVAMEAVRIGVKRVGILTIPGFSHTSSVSEMAGAIDLKIGDSWILGRAEEDLFEEDGTKRWDLLLQTLLSW
jgi:hypothetical protein